MAIDLHGPVGHWIAHALEGETFVRWIDVFVSPPIASTGSMPRSSRPLRPFPCPRPLCTSISRLPHGSAFHPSACRSPSMGRESLRGSLYREGSGNHPQAFPCRVLTLYVVPLWHPFLGAVSGAPHLRCHHVHYAPFSHAVGGIRRHGRWYCSFLPGAVPVVPCHAKLAPRVHSVTNGDASSRACALLSRQMCLHRSTRLWSLSEGSRMTVRLGVVALAHPAVACPASVCDPENHPAFPESARRPFPFPLMTPSLPILHHGHVAHTRPRSRHPPPQVGQPQSHSSAPAPYPMDPVCGGCLPSNRRMPRHPSDRLVAAVMLAPLQLSFRACPPCYIGPPIVHTSQRTG